MLAPGFHGAEIGAAEGGMVQHPCDGRIVDIREHVGLRGIAAGTGHKIDVPRQQLPFPVVRFVRIHIFATRITVRIPVAGNVFDAEHPHPRFHIHDRFGLRGIGGAVWIVHRIDQGKERLPFSVSNSDELQL